jgi:predicted enzyme related to lactoylglutathione lyase
MNRPIHFEILADNPEKVIAFYQQVFNWQIAGWEGPQSYWLATTGPEDTPGINGGFMNRHFQQAVINTIEVDSINDYLAKIEAAGGKKILGPREVPGVGLHAYCKDPEGSIFGIMQTISANEP